jgi:ankyrin repeat protein|tara:strand:+ start:192 stop:578 length:387 start_codon:yes stop_codon:yes gene_type:complete
VHAVEALLSAGADATIGEGDGYTPMHGAGFQGRAEVAKLLIAHGLDPSDVHSDGYTPLHRSCWGGEQRHTEMARVLLEAGVPHDQKATDGKTPIEMVRAQQPCLHCACNPTWFQPPCMAALGAGCSPI